MGRHRHGPFGLCADKSGTTLPIVSNSDPARLRVSDEERHQVAEILREAAGAGRLDLDELDQRLDAAYAAKTYADLVPLTHDLPVPSLGRPPAQRAGALPAPGGDTHERHVAFMSGFDRKGVWTVPAELSVTCVMGGADIDLRQAQFSSPEVVITVHAFMGGAEITVNPQTHVVIEGTAFMGGFSGPSDRHPAELDASSPTVRVRGLAVMGGVSVSRKPPREPRRLRLR